MLLFSAETGGFYDTAIHPAGLLPADTVEVTEEEREAALAALAPGLAITADATGKPTVAPVEPDADTRLALIRRRRNRLLDASDATQLADYPLSEASRSAWADYRQALRDLPEGLTDAAAPVWPTPPEESAPETPAD